MYIKTTYDENFDDLMMHLKSKYSQKLFDLDGIGKQLDMSAFSKNFFSSKVTSDASIDANANVDDVSVIAYNTELPKPYLKLNSYYILWKELKRLYGQEVANNIVEMQLTGDIYIHDFHGVASGQPYCFNYSAYDVMQKGLPMVKKVKSLPPKHLYAFKSQLEQFTVVASNSTLGATGLADLLVVMSYYVSKILNTGNDAGFFFDGWFSDEEKLMVKDMLLELNKIDIINQAEELDVLVKDINKRLHKTSPNNPEWFESNVYKYVKENLVSFIYTINQPMRANQSPFTNVSVYDDNFLNKMCDDYIFPDLSKPNIQVIKKVQNLFLSTMNEELRRTPLTFPVTTACFSVDENKNILDEAFLELIAKQNKEFGFINIYAGDSSTLSSCCRLRSERKSEYFNSFGAGSSKIGSLGVCSINFPRLAIKYNNPKDFFEALKKMVEVCAQVNNAKRYIVKKRIENGNEPLYTYKFMDITKQYSTVGVNGFNECIEIMGYNILEESGQNFGLKIMEVINECNDKYEKQYDAPHNCEQVPGENMSIKMADKDRLLGYQHEYSIYSNQFIPLITNADMLDRIKLQGLFDKHFSGGSILHLNVDTPIEDIEDIKELIRVTAKMGVVYHAINYVLGQCEDGHMSVGNDNICPICGKEIKDKYTRVVGFLTNVKNWHKVRREQDFPNRQFYNGVGVKVS